MTEPTILFENEGIVVVDKPAGMRVHPASGEQLEGTVAGWHLVRNPAAHDACEDPLRPGIVHRLDQDTSGVMVLAKTAQAFSFLKKQFAERNITKVYRALACGIFAEDRGVIDRAVASDPEDRKQKTVPMGEERSRQAITYWKVLERFAQGDGYTYLEAYPKTGRTHQIRIHMRSVGHPLVCDKLYGVGGRCPVGPLARQALHAFSLECELPDGSGRHSFTAPLPADFEGALASLREGVL